MNQNEVEAVLGHEISHVANGDMVTLTLIQGVVNTFVIFLSRILGNLVDRTLFGGRDREERGNGPAYFISVIVFGDGAGLPREHDRRCGSRGIASSVRTTAARSCRDATEHDQPRSSD